MRTLLLLLVVACTLCVAPSASAAVQILPGPGTTGPAATDFYIQQDNGTYAYACAWQNHETLYCWKTTDPHSNFTCVVQDTKKNAWCRKAGRTPEQNTATATEVKELQAFLTEAVVRAMLFPNRPGLPAGGGGAGPAGSTAVTPAWGGAGSPRRTARGSCSTGSIPLAVQMDVFPKAIQVDWNDGGVPQWINVPAGTGTYTTYVQHSYPGTSYNPGVDGGVYDEPHHTARYVAEAWVYGQNKSAGLVIEHEVSDGDTTH